MGRVSRGCAQHRWGGNHPLPKEAAPTLLEITLARKTCALHTSTSEGLPFAEGSAVSFLTFFGFSSLCLWHWKHKWINAQLNSCIRAPRPCYWGSTNKATQCPCKQVTGMGSPPAVLWLPSGTGMLFCSGLVAAFSASQGCTPFGSLPNSLHTFWL